MYFLLFSDGAIMRKISESLERSRRVKSLLKMMHILQICCHRSDAANI